MLVNIVLLAMPCVRLLNYDVNNVRPSLRKQAALKTAMHTTFTTGVTKCFETEEGLERKDTESAKIL